MDEQSAKMDRRVDDLQRDIADLRREITVLMARSFRWTIATIVVAVLAVWFGVFIIVKSGGITLRQFLLR